VKTAETSAARLRCCLHDQVNAALQTLHVEKCMRVIALVASSVLLLVGAGAALAQSAAIEGSYRDRYGTVFAISTCGEGGTICAVLKELQGDSRTVENLEFLNKLVLEATPIADNQWEGALTFNGATATAVITLEDANTLNIKGCRGILCASLNFVRE
jgi:uncharacterized protein (DUF2147 family)